MSRAASFWCGYPTGEVILGDLSKSGFQITQEHEDADAIVVNTCAFVEDAKSESIEAIMASPCLFFPFACLLLFHCLGLTISVGFVLGKHFSDLFRQVSCTKNMKLAKALGRPSVACPLSSPSTGGVS